MQKYMVSVDVTSDQHSVDEISDLFGIEAGVGSSNKGDLLPLNKVCTFTTWRVESELPGMAPLDEHFAYLAALFGLDQPSDRRLPEDLHKYVSIGVLHHTYTCSVQIAAKWLGMFAANGIDLEVCCYPCSREE